MRRVKSARRSRFVMWFKKLDLKASDFVAIISLFLSIYAIYQSQQGDKEQEKVTEKVLSILNKQEQSLGISRIALEKAVNLISKQTQTLDTSRTALQSVVKLITRQQQILDAGLAVSKEQYKDIKQKNDDERRKASYKAELAISVSVDSITYTSKNFVKKYGDDWLMIKLDKSFLNKKIPTKVILENIGKIAAKGTLLLLLPLDLDIEKITGKNPPFDFQTTGKNKIDIEEFYDYYSMDIPVTTDPLAVFAPVYTFNITPRTTSSAIKINVHTANGVNKFIILYIEIRAFS